MLVVTIARSDAGIRSIEASGHAGYAARGRDIVCAGASAVLLTALIGLEQVAGARVYMRRNDRTGRLKLALPQGLSGQAARDAATILATAAAGLRAIGREHPRNMRVITRKWRKQP
ncbi:MAG: ribosomal-processing cysteine protease Prp [Clostridiales bacterium]|nr:ribosomal-processing cysteine protease Prp [Clostridiales bacterium]